MLLHPKLDDLLKRVDSKYTLVTLSAKRARNINAILSSDYRQGLEALAPMDDKLKSYKPLDIALKEIDMGKISYRRMEDGIK